MFTRQISIMFAGPVLCLALPAFAEDASRDRAEFDAAAGRTIFQNVLLADPNAFSSRPRLRASLSPSLVTEPPATTGEGSVDRRDFDAAAGRADYSALQTQPTPSPARNAQPNAGKPQRTVRVILPSPYGR
jgi:hypothetical protein